MRERENVRVRDRDRDRGASLHGRSLVAGCCACTLVCERERRTERGVVYITIHGDCILV